MHKVLIVGPAWVGDMVMAQGLYKTLCRRYSGVVIDVLAPAWSGPLLQRMPEVRRHVELPLGHGQFGLGARVRLGRALRGERYDQAIIIPRSFKTALPPFFAAIPRRTGYKGEMRYGLINDMRPLDKSVLTQTVQRYVALGMDADTELPPAEIPQPRLDVDIQNQQRLMDEFKLSRDRPIVGFMPGAEYGPAKRWPPESFARLAQRIIDSGRQVWLFGSDKDEAICDDIATEVDRVEVVNLAGRTRLVDAIDLIAAVDMAVTNDSGLMHIAAATGVEVIAIYGSSSPAYTPPLTEQAQVVYLNLDCSPCFERECPLGHYRCLRDIAVERVFSHLEGRRCQQ
ncbi:ADP-heptose--LPS heptosyltransferase [Candidatus Tenderia electrophaga]|jgi:heptosyltransferase-2|uniref:lipopolysaccharide heptosyltransferase II n=1 Tax=Candidatus Tenderia electrophaga TaxID=1748243 RepID=A0A0S2TAI8_9GAMM|nr:ADP-heptose--LPS heptosyltransferase [Candidatus Tenderia electrophaga]